MKTGAIIASLALALLLPDAAWAHSPIKGINNFYNGVLHPLLVPAHLLLIIVTGLWIGQAGLKKADHAIYSYSLALIIGLVIGWFHPGGEYIELIVLGLAAAIGVTVAAAPSLPSYVYPILAAVAGVLLGLDSAQNELYGKEKFLSMLGSAVSIYFFLLYPLVLAHYARGHHWLSVIVRIIGSWIAASALLVLTLATVKR